MCHLGWTNSEARLSFESNTIDFGLIDSSVFGGWTLSSFGACRQRNRWSQRLRMKCPSKCCGPDFGWHWHHVLSNSGILQGICCLVRLAVKYSTRRSHSKFYWICQNDSFEIVGRMHYSWWVSSKMSLFSSRTWSYSSSTVVFMMVFASSSRQLAVLARILGVIALLIVWCRCTVPHSQYLVQIFDHLDQRELVTDRGQGDRRCRVRRRGSSVLIRSLVEKLAMITAQCLQYAIWLFSSSSFALHLDPSWG